MEKLIELKQDDAILKRVKFKIYGYKDKRVAHQFLPDPDEPDTKNIDVSGGNTLIIKRGDYLVSDAGDPEHAWPVEKEIFEQSHQEEQPGSGLFRKISLVMLAPLTEFTGGNPDQMVIVHTLEGPETVRAGDYHVARGIKGEIWPFPNDRIEKHLYEVEY